MKGQRAKLTEAQFERIGQLVHDRCGFVLRAEQRPTLERHIGERLGALGFDSPERYLAHIAGAGEAEFHELVEGVLVQETFFFRTPAHFSALQGKLAAELMERPGFRTRPLKLWSAGCATGPEPYSAAIALLDSPAGERFSVIATDISTRALEEARRGVYGGRVVRGIPPEALARHFEAEGDAWRVRERVRARIQFTALNLSCDRFPDEVDILFCRNVLIYFPAPVRERIIRGFHAVLTERGAVFLGHSETLSDFADLFERSWIDRTFVFRKRAAAGPLPAPAADSRKPLEDRTPRGVGFRPLGFAPTAIAPESRPAVQVVEVEGALDGSHAADVGERLKQQVIACLGDREPRVILDLRRVSFLDAAGVRLLSRTARLVQDHGGRSCFVCGDPVRRWLEREQEREALELYDSLQAAQEAFAP